jgi:hypothetical protein
MKRWPEVRAEAQQIRSDTWAPLGLSVVNRGDRATADTIINACARSTLTALSEMHDQRKTLAVLEREGFGVWAGNREDSWANPVVWQPDEFHARRFLSFHLLPAGRRAGKYNMAKTLNVVAGVHLDSGRHLAFGSLHNIQSQYLPGRGKPALQFVRNAIAAADEFKIATFLAGDWNAKPTARTMRPIYGHGWRYTQRDDYVKTHWAGIDGIAWDDRNADPSVVRFVGQSARPIKGSDHDQLLANFLLRRRPD